MHVSRLSARVSAARFQRWFLPAFAFKAGIIGGGYATGRELAEFFLPSGPRGGLLAMLLATAMWSMVCVATFAFAFSTQSFDYRTFFRRLLGPGWVAFEVAYACMVLLILSVFAAASGEIGKALFAWPPIAGTVLLVSGIALVAGFGSVSVERLFKYVTIFLYAVYAVFLLLACTRFWDLILVAFARPVPVTGWISGGLTYGAYNVICGVVVLPTLRFLRSRRDAVIAGLVCGPLAILPAVCFFSAMAAFYPHIGRSALPADTMLRALDAPIFHIVFQLMIFAALLESGVSFVHAINERLAAALRSRLDFGWRTRMMVSSGILIGAIFVANGVGLVSLIARGYRALALLVILVYILPLALRGIWLLLGKQRLPTSTC